MKLLLLLLPIYLLAFNIEPTVNHIKQAEGFRANPYSDSNHWSIGYGTNLSYITRTEAALLLNHRLAIRHERLMQFAWYRKLSPIRKSTVLELAYQVGITGVLKFKHMIWALERNYWNGSANALLDSKLARQTPSRAKRMAYQIKYNRRP